MGIISDAMKESDSMMNSFIANLRDVGFTGCPICKNPDGFAWAHATQTPLGLVRMSAFIPGATTVPGDDTGRTESFPTPLWMLICDNCSYVMTFSKTHMAFRIRAQKNEQ